MKHSLLTFLLGVMISSCLSQEVENENIALIDEFVQEMVFNQKISKSTINSYFDIANDNYEEMIPFFQSTFSDLQEKIGVKCSKQYQILSYKEAKKIDIIGISSFEKGGYNKYPNAFFIVCGDTIMLPLILEGKKIISFSTALKSSSGDPSKPAFINR